MTIADLLAILAETTAVGSAAILAVFSVRGRVRRSFGAGLAYATWLVVPVALLAVLLPASAAGPEGVAAGWVGVPRVLGASLAAGATDVATGHWLIVVWAIGVAGMAWRFALQQRRFAASLGVLRDRGDGTSQAQAVAGLPAVLGVVRPRIVLPADFEHRYDARQQVLLRAHERIHVSRGDLRVNALVAAVRCAFWFNPLVHLAASAFRLDQELACDARVMRRFPSLRRPYGDAMIRTQLAIQPLPMGCHWGFQHPLKERIDMLRQPHPSTLRRLAGGSLVLALAMACGVAAWAGQPPADTAPRVAGESTPPPAYPAGAAAQGIGGRVMLLIDIDASGLPTNITVEEADPAGVFDAVAVEAARAWRFNPAIEDGRAVPSRVRVPVDFSPDGPPAEVTTIDQHPAG